MEAEARYTWVGAIVVSLVAALIACVIWLKNVGGDAEFARYLIYFQSQSLDGLEIGADVNLLGIKVGRVEDFALADEVAERVRVTVRVDKRTPLRTSTVAVLTRNYVTGIASIALVTRQPVGAVLAAAPAGERYPVIAEGRSEFDEFSGRVTRLGDKAAMTFEGLNQLLSAENRELTMQTVHNLRELTAGLTQRLKALDSTLERVGGAADRLGLASDRVAGTTERLGTRLDTTLGEAERVMADARLAMRQIAEAGAAVQQEVRSSARQLEATAGNVDHQLEAAVAELRVSIEAATRVLDGLRDPRAALLGPSNAQLGPGEKRP